MPHSPDPVRNAAYMREYRKSGTGKAYFQRYHRSEKYRKRDRAAQIKKRYGITGEQYDAMLAAQSNGCAICGQPAHPRFRLSVDHNHATGQVRGLLCQRCNVAIAVLECSALPALEAYIEKWNSLHHGVTSAAAEVSAQSTCRSRPGSSRVAPHDMPV